MLGAIQQRRTGFTGGHLYLPKQRQRDA